MSEYVLDASAILALLNSETGGEVVLSLLPRAFVSTVNLAEVYARLAAAGMSAPEIREVISLLGLSVVDFDQETAFASGELYRHTQPPGLSLGDRACLALAQRMGAVAVTADRAWLSIETGIQIRLIR